MACPSSCVSRFTVADRWRGRAAARRRDRRLSCAGELCASYGCRGRRGTSGSTDTCATNRPASRSGSGRPAWPPNETAEEIVTALVTVCRRHPTWGGKKLLALLDKQHPRWLLPGRSTACEILKRHRMVRRRQP